jgi:polyisoprenoid-binding protein YceI
MKTKNLALGVVMLLVSHAAFAQKVDVNTKDSSVKWSGKKIGGQHDGNIQLKSAYLELNKEQLVAGKIVVDMTTISNNDLKDEGSRQKLVGHLKSDDFFGVEKFPTATFVLKNGSVFTNGKATVTGDLSIKDKTETISFEVVKAGKIYTSKIEIDRSKFHVRYGSDSFFDNLGDKAIDDMFILDIKLVVN